MTEFYISISIDQGTARPVVVLSASGGVDIEDIATSKPEEIVTRFLNPLDELIHCLEIVAQAGLKGKALVKVASVLKKLYILFTKYDATLLEINPLFINSEGEVIVPHVC